MFDTKIAIVIRDDIAVWQKLNVTAFLTSGVLGASEGLIGEAYEDADGNAYGALLIQPVIVLGTNAEGIRKIYGRAMSRNVRMSIYIEDMFKTGNDIDNRATVKQHASADLNLVGLALRDDKKIVDKITKGAKMHP
ncbi:MAG: DUF2000 family protein [Hyphomicrobiaceae bacterium]